MTFCYDKEWMREGIKKSGMQKMHVEAWEPKVKGKHM